MQFAPAEAKTPDVSDPRDANWDYSGVSDVGDLRFRRCTRATAHFYSPHSSKPSQTADVSHRSWMGGSSLLTELSESPRTARRMVQAVPQTPYQPWMGGDSPPLANSHLSSWT